MIKPGLERVQELANAYSIVPVCREIYADIITPITLLRKIAGISRRCFLLESVEGGEKWGRYSFLGFDPVMRVFCKDGKVTLEQDGRQEVRTTDQPLDVLREIQAGYRAPKLPEMPPFSGGFVGYFAYAMIGYAEPKLKIKRGVSNDFDLMLFDRVIAYDHLKQKICLIANVRTDRADRVAENHARAAEELDRLAAMIRDIRPLPQLKSQRNVEFVSNVSRKDYGELVERTKAYIRAGDIFQAVISRQFTAPYEGSLINAYRVLRMTNPSPYMVYLCIDDNEIMSTSPETLVRLQNGRLTTFPVAGSRPRGRTEEEDLQLEKELLADEKELSEHNMLVDLGRNDLGRISRFSSVEVREYMMIHRYSRIMHICSQVESDILPERDGCSAIEAVLPAGTLSGAPKIRACEIIEEMEKEPRGIYGGALGYLDFTGNMDTCIAIRMAVKQGGRVYVQAGGGIVADSLPDNEYDESAHKALAVMKAVQEAGEVDEG
ncbi:MAG TPA: anthranilate synthase component I [Clostridiales bacterium]|nr:anthranilate synthase component I [Clostridiales bacterium]